jgi:hypothetical protein
MMRKKGIWVFFLMMSLAIILGSQGHAESQATMDAAEIIKKSRETFYYAGDDLNARVRMTLTNKEGKTRLREMTMLRKNYGNGLQRYYAYFYAPLDVRDTTFLVWKYPQKDDDRWIFIPAIKMVRRIAAADKRSSFVGSDFTYEDFSGREVEDDKHKLLREEKMEGRDCYVIESIPLDNVEYKRRVSWIDTSHFLPLKEEYYDVRDELYRVFTADTIKEVEGFPTVIKRTMRDTKTGHFTEVLYEEIRYNVGLSDDVFQERGLRRPPREWLK